MTSDKKGIALLTEIFVKKGLKQIVISPGSRNAPIIISFAQHPKIKAISIVDERSAAFFALGMAQQTKQTVAIACTSGTAALNYAPAIAEAYYQKVPLLVLTADRPEELIDQGDGQAIRQKNVYANYIIKSFELPQEISNEADFNFAEKIINEAINLTQYPDFGPVHINIPFNEPLYNQVEKHSFEANIFEPVIKPKSIPEEKIKEFAERWNGYEKKLLIAGMMDTNTRLEEILNKIADDPSVVLLTETISNLKNSCTCPCIDRVVSTILPEEIENFRPVLLVTFGGQVISKMVKAFIRKNKPLEHWHIDPIDFQMDTYQCLTSGIPVKPTSFFSQILPLVKPKKSKFNFNWIERDKRSENRYAQFLSKCEFSDLKVFETILKAIPKGSNLQMGNSTPVRYVQLFKPFQKLTYNSNRGTSGIDGTVSTAAGAAYVSKKPTTIITGDLGFFYDSNALMNNYLSENLRIIIINNSGGGIFRFIPGPGETDQLEEFFETKHDWKAEFIAKNFNIHYYSANHLNSLNTSLEKFYKLQPNNKPAILEVFTPNEKNAVTLKEYFKYLKF
ncbi:MAG: 2-succinyl-5-enolpyruvyl-6-hydroxy-3-cyclohexene-1-carboxylic-acid synthase [Bacteroidetes bacterium]|nr:2-succinyl-5-enolpyruvyl-6-hydroxy-3-cyclohexene-1-carboxylic-acid synthase [Bacteroidota bacterium]MBL7104773.1 2-succinyl-5-enolpyruvyl-6-hydroxy-3-cyclohexene-1-carboxylic-acid synthase [Bacteroidales bacterium]